MLAMILSFPPQRAQVLAGRCYGCPDAADDAVRFVLGGSIDAVITRRRIRVSGEIRVARTVHAGAGA
jgi:hypothetical protein